MGRKKKKDNERKGKTISLRLTDKDFDVLVRLSGKLDMSYSNLMRQGLALIDGYFGENIE